jgi:hypothetical protein
LRRDRLDGAGRAAADFSVAIRTLSVAGDRIVMNVGGGVVQDSTVAWRMGGGAVESALREGGRQPG